MPRGELRGDQGIISILLSVYEDFRPDKTRRSPSVYFIAYGNVTKLRQLLSPDLQGKYTIIVSFTTLHDALVSARGSSVQVWNKARKSRSNSRLLD